MGSVDNGFTMRASVNEQIPIRRLPFQGHLLSTSEYRSALRADHGTVRRFLAGCRCPFCDRPAHRRFLEFDALASRVSLQRTSGMEQRPTGDLRRVDLEQPCSSMSASPGYSAGAGIG